MTNSTLEDNEADYLGGGIALDGSQTQALLEGNDIIHNSAPINGGGGISTNNGSSVIHTSGTIAYNTGGFGGGGVRITQAEFVLSGGDIVSNTADSGGGVYMYVDSTSAFTQTGGTIAHNQANNGSGGGIYAYQGDVALIGGQITHNSASYSGGGILVWSANVTMTDTQVVSNSASFSGGGGIYLSQGSATLNMSGGAINNNSTSSTGGGLCVSDGSVTLTGTQVLSNSASSGGGVYTWRGSVTLSGTQVVSNSASSGGGVYVGSLGNAALTGTQVLSNSASSRGGGLYVASGSATLSGVQITDNNAPGGSALYNRGTITPTTALTITGDVYQAGGHFAGSSHDLQVEGALVLAGGDFYAPDAPNELTITGLYTHTGGTYHQTQLVNGSVDVGFPKAGGLILNANGQNLASTTVTLTAGIDCAGVPAGESIEHCYDISPANTTGRDAIATFFYQDGEVPASQYCTAMEAYRWTGAWGIPLTRDTASYGDQGRLCGDDPQSIRVTGVTDFSPFALRGVVPEISVDPSSLDFGDQDVDAGPTVSQTVTITNGGLADLHVTSISLTGNDPSEFVIESGGDAVTLTANSTHTIQVSFDPSITGVMSTNLTIESDDDDEATVDVALAGTGIAPDLTIAKMVDTGGLDPVPLGSVVTYTLVISNGGDGAAFGLVITDPLPAGLNYGTQVDGGTVILPQGNLLSWGPATISGQGEHVITFTATVTDDVAFAEQDVVNTAYFTATNHVSGASNSVTFTIAAAPVNTPPTISDISNQSTEVSTPISVTFTISDAETALDALALSADSGNTALVMVGNITFEGSGTDRTATITPTGGMTGTVTITITVDDGEDTAYDAFVLTVTQAPPVNTPPTISDISNQSTEVNTPISVTFTISDAETALDALALSADSGNTALVMVGNITFEGSGTDRTAAITPTGGMTGTVTITITVDDGEDTAYDAFVLTVTQAPPVNTPPTISDISNQSTEVNTPISVTFTISDAETALDALALSADSGNTALVMVGNITFEGSGTDRTATITPTNGITGTATITVTVDDGALSGSDSFVLAVGDVNAPPEFTSSPPLTGTVGTLYTYDVTASDPDVDDTLTITATTKPTWLALTDNGDGTATLSGTPTLTDTYDVVLEVNDGKASETQSFTITVDAAPVADSYIYLPLVLRLGS